MQWSGHLQTMEFQMIIQLYGPRAGELDPKTTAVQQRCAVIMNRCSGTVEAS